MIILDRTQANNTINFIPRSYNPTGGNIFKIELKKEAENTVNYTANVSALTSLKYLRLSKVIEVLLAQM